jgi:uracil-DNA glycosylase
MTLKREDMLRELELLPVWKARQPQADKSMSASVPKPQPPTEIMAQAQSEIAAEQTVAKSRTPKIEPPKTEPEAPLEEVDSPAEKRPVKAAEKDQPSALLSPMGEDRVEIIMHMNWPALEQAVTHCPACNLCKTRTKTVFGVGDPNAEWLFVGEAPGAEEDRKGEPFVGQAGKLLDNMLAAIKLKRGTNVYIANVLKCRPPDNRDPQGEEVMQCAPYLKRQVELIKPKLIVALGKFAAQSLLDSKSTIAAMRGKLHDYQGVPVIVTYHPAYLLRNLHDKAKAWEDLCYAVETMRSL